ncbi:MAG: hypothetical protein HN657_04200 [Candidatus Marinimicrobia bacterium]|jgi:hypothetical protein|nr:hypothetical protein [Candidatus Neomarinimicrobiota bacterium]MBT3495715.1 hypothetical protein [Candidatus Neomarinimicrobiota bacterium]MBT3692220.1 hypothetical protein [Candidatus Neomarinimicrobiota bacterium]MBT3731771.1 hypothetical protein [Candidatus Neomarinimicrobiota bacterium]MBT4145196.1 hypothetical protein [Candidatus Neomarinimicrobiota bacterium]
MTRYFLLSLLLVSSLFAEGEFQKKKKSPSEFWGRLSTGHKVSFINGVYSAVTTMKRHHKHEVYRQHKGDPNWTRPYYIERYYEIIDEYYSESVGYDLRVLALHMDALYANYDNRNIPIMEALHIVSLAQDGDRSRADLKLLQAQRKYNP